MRKNFFKLFSEKILNTPLWFKQVLFLELFENMKENCCENIIHFPKENIFSTYVPTITFKGRTELETHECGFDSNIYNFLKLCTKGYNIIEISVCMFLSMEETAKYYEFCLEQKFINRPDSKEIETVANYISGKLRLGEYLLNKGVLTQEQLDDAISLYSTHNDKRFGEVLLILKYVQPENLKEILTLKDESKKRFILDYNSLPEVKKEFLCDNEKYEAEINKLKQENKQLQKKMSQLLALVKKDE